MALGVSYTGRYEFPEKTFYWCSQATGMTFKQFPALNDQHVADYDQMANMPFSGDWAKVHKKVEDPEEQEALRKRHDEKAHKEVDPLESTEEEDPQSLIVKINLKELDRLHYHVRAIENDCHIVPQGSMKINSHHEVQRNEAFQGLPGQECFDIKFYSHFRNVQSEQKRIELETDDSIFNRAFLDDAAKDLPKMCWSVQRSQDQSVAVIRNNVWRGYTAFAKVNSQDHGSVYVGDGLKNENFCFML